MSEMDEKVLDEAMESSTEENASETKEDENVTSTEETAETAENADAEASEADSEDPDKKKSFFKKKKDKKDEQIEELTDKVKRQMAEFDNFRKRTEKEKSQMYDMGAKTIVERSCRSLITLSVVLQQFRKITKKMLLLSEWIRSTARCLPY